MQVKNIIKKHLDPNVTIAKNAKGFQVYQFTNGDKKYNLSYYPVKEATTDYEGYSDWENLNNTGEFKITLVGVNFNYFKQWTISERPMVNVTVLGNTHPMRKPMTTKELNKLNDDSFTKWCETFKNKEASNV